MSAPARVGRAVWLAPRYALLGLVRVYQLVGSPLVGPVCRYAPSCSAYAATALVRHGAVRGTLLAAWRVARCHPWAAGGVDDVPPARPRRTPADGAADRAATRA